MLSLNDIETYLNKIRETKFTSLLYNQHIRFFENIFECLGIKTYQTNTLMLFSESENQIEFQIV